MHSIYFLHFPTPFTSTSFFTIFLNTPPPLSLSLSLSLSLYYINSVPDLLFFFPTLRLSFHINFFSVLFCHPYPLSFDLLDFSLILYHLLSSIFFTITPPPITLCCLSVLFILYLRLLLVSLHFSPHLNPVSPQPTLTLSFTLTLLSLLHLLHSFLFHNITLPFTICCSRSHFFHTLYFLLHFLFLSFSSQTSLSQRLSKPFLFYIFYSNTSLTPTPAKLSFTS